MRKSAILFDFDYTLADSSKGAVECINYALQAIDEKPRSWDSCCRTIGLSLPDTYRALTGKNDPDEVAAFHCRFVERADQTMAASTELYDGVGELVHRLSSMGFVLGILSTKFRYRISEILKRYDLTEQFSAIVGGEDVQKSKPDPEGLQLLLEQIAMEPDQAILIGDSITDAKTAFRGRVDFIAVLTGNNSADEFSAYSPTAVLESVTEFEKHAERIIATDADNGFAGM